MNVHLPRMGPLIERCIHPVVDLSSLSGFPPNQDSLVWVGNANTEPPAQARKKAELHAFKVCQSVRS